MQQGDDKAANTPVQSVGDFEQTLLEAAANATDLPKEMPEPVDLNTNAEVTKCVIISNGLGKRKRWTAYDYATGTRIEGINGSTDLKRVLVDTKYHGEIFILTPDGYIPVSYIPDHIDDLFANKVRLEESAVQAIMMGEETLGNMIAAIEVLTPDAVQKGEVKNGANASDTSTDTTRQG